jgi:16S rRNA (uracil1498-N3)-methyltransferase
MSSRYFVSNPIDGDRATLEGAEAHHLLHVMRAKLGEEVTLFDGSGREFTARIERLGRSDVELAILTQAVVDRESPMSITLGVALPKGDRQTWLIEKATELGVGRVVPMITERSVAQPTASALDRLRRAVVEASKQCGRNRLMEIAEPQPWQAFVDATPQETCRLIAHPNGASRPEFASAMSYVIAIGPEGGFTDDEVATALDAGWQAFDLGSRILRLETASVYAVAMITAQSSLAR